MTVSFLSLVIGFKIIVTFVSVSRPFLFAPKPSLEELTEITAHSDTFFRLYGVAITALLVGYASAFPTMWSGQFPWGIVLMGTVSNGGAAYVLLRHPTPGKLRSSAFLFGAIFVALLASMMMPQLAISPWF